MKFFCVSKIKGLLGYNFTTKALQYDTSVYKDQTDNMIHEILQKLD